MLLELCQKIVSLFSISHTFSRNINVDDFSQYKIQDQPSQSRVSEKVLRKRIVEGKMQSADKIVGRVIKCRAHFATSSSSRSTLTLTVAVRRARSLQCQGCGHSPCMSLLTAQHKTPCLGHDQAHRKCGTTLRPKLSVTAVAQFGPLRPVAAVTLPRRGMRHTCYSP